MALTAVIKVDIRVVQSQCESCRGKKATLLSVMENIKKVMTALATISWISPASARLLQKFLQLYRQCEEAIRIVEEYIHDLEITAKLYTEADKRLTEKADSLKTDIFGI